MNKQDLQDAVQTHIRYQWTVQCECRHHKNTAWVRISPAELIEMAFKLQADPFTSQGARSINHAILSGTSVK